MKVLVVGATGGSGRAVADELLSRGHEVTAFARRASALGDFGCASGKLLRTVDGDATDPGTIDSVVDGHDAVIVTLGISENPIRVRLRGPAHTVADIRSRGTRNVIAAMRRTGSRRLVVLSTYGVGETAGMLRLSDRIFFALLIKPQVADHAKQEAMVRASGLDWTIVQPVHLTDQGNHSTAYVSDTGNVAGFRVSRKAVACVVADTLGNHDHLGRSLAVSGMPG
jgi:uncharacterized protein YbjT (DUF2867 family)